MKGSILFFSTLFLFSCGGGSETVELVQTFETSPRTGAVNVGRAMNIYVNVTANGNRPPTNVSVVAPTSPYRIISSYCGENSDPSVKRFMCRILVEFRPTSTGNFNDSLQIRYNNNGTPGTNTTLTVDMNYTGQRDP